VNNLHAICFDLDDTLWDMRPVIQRAEQQLYDWYTQNYPRVTELYTPAALRRSRMQATERWPELGHDLTELRMRLLRQLAAEAGYPEAMADEAFAVFIAARNDVTLYADVVPVLERLAGRYRLYALSNGNADLEKIGIAGLFAGVFTARQMGVAKPDSRFFTEAAVRCDESAADLLHVGDHPENDIVAARRTGMRAVWLNRLGTEWPFADHRPDEEIASLHELAELLDA